MTLSNVLVRRLARLALVVAWLTLVMPAWGQWSPGKKAGQGGSPVQIAGQILPPSGGAPASLQITATLESGWHIYSIAQPPGGPLATKIALQPSDAYRLKDQFQASPPPEKKAEEAFDGTIVESHYDQVVWSAPIELAPGADPRQLRIDGTVKFQPCNAKGCMLPQTVAFTAVATNWPVAPSLPAPSPQPPAVATPPAFPAPVAQRAPVAPVAPATPPPAAPPNPGSENAAATAAVPQFDPAAVQAEQAAQNQGVGLRQALVLGFLGGLILNLMPCVLPVIGLKILSFLEQAGHSRQRAFTLNLWYSLGLMSVFLVLAGLAAFVGIGWGQQFGYRGFTITLAAVVFAMGLSFLGIWEVPIPGFIGRGSMNTLAEREGASGAFAKGALTTVLATPCSAPFLGSALTWALSQPPAVIFAVFAAVGLGMASPYLLLGAFPELLRILPKPGVWMETFKQLMGFVLLGTVVFLLAGLRPAAYVVPTVALLFGVWLACWWIGRTPATAEPGDQMRAWLSAVVIVGFTYLISFSWLAGIMEARYNQKFESLLPWQPFTRASFDEAVRGNNTVLVDFTADWCLTCKTLEALVLETEPVRQAVEANRIVTLKGDCTESDSEGTQMLTLLGAKQVPVLAIFPAGDPNRPIVQNGSYTQRSLLEALRKAGPSQKPPAR